MEKNKDVIEQATEELWGKIVDMQDGGPQLSKEEWLAVLRRLARIVERTDRWMDDSSETS